MGAAPQVRGANTAWVQIREGRGGLLIIFGEARRAGNGAPPYHGYLIVRAILKITFSTHEGATAGTGTPRRPV